MGATIEEKDSLVVQQGAGLHWLLGLWQIIHVATQNIHSVLSKLNNMHA